MNEFIEECRREWQRLGVPDHIANEMATDLKADIDEAESEGGSAEDVLGNSLFDPRRFAAAWAESRGVTAPPAAAPSIAASSAVVPASAEPGPVSRPSLMRRVTLPVALAVLAVVLVIGGFALAVGNRGSSLALSVRRVLRPGAFRLFRPRSLPLVVVHGPRSVGDASQGLAILAALMVLVGVIALAIAVLSWAPWTRRQSG